MIQDDMRIQAQTHLFWEISLVHGHHPNLIGCQTGKMAGTMTEQNMSTQLTTKRSQLSGGLD